MKIGFCTSDQIERVMRFFDQHWAKNHILSRHRALVDWQHYDRRADRYNFVVASDDTGSIVGTLGFIPTSQFDPALRDHDTVWLTSWKVIQSAGPTGLGLRLHSFLERNVPHQVVGTVGNNEHAGKIYQALGYQTGAMRQYYVLNEARQEFVLCDIPNHRSAEIATGPTSNELRRLDLQQLDLRQLRNFANTIRFDQPANVLPLKSPEYFINRFLKHPIYHYQVYAIIDRDRPLGLVAIRCAEALGQRALRIVDVYGDPNVLRLLRFGWQSILNDAGAEYLDIHCHGPLEDSLQAAGMTKLDPTGDVVIPNHFEPFARKNIVIQWAYKAPAGTRYQVFKADADQDRPNQIG